MTTVDRDPLFDPRISDWLEGDPDIAPGFLLETVVAALPSIPQRRAMRAPWRFPKMSIPVRIAAVAALVVLVAAGAVFLQRPDHGQVGAPSQSPTASPSPTGSAAPSSSAALLDLPDTFTSPQYGYTISVAPAWTITPATLTWSGPDNNSVDLITFPDGGGMSAGSEALLPNQTWAQWLNEFQPPSLVGGCNGPAPKDWTPIQIGDQIGGWQQMCGPHGEAIVQSGDRAYVFTYGIGDAPDPVSFDQFKQILTTVRFDPTAVVAPAPPPALSQDFASNRYGYSLEYPAGYTAVKATSPVSSFLPDPAGPQVDAVTNASARLVVWSERLDAGQTFDAWAQAYCQSSRNAWTQPCDGAPGNWREVPLASGTARLMVDGESVGTYVHDESRLFRAITTAGGRAYVIQMDGDLNENLFLAILASMRLDPASAK
jgi:hypothetical protein